MGWLEMLGRELAFRNREGIEAYDFVLARSRPAPGVSAVVRVRNEAGTIVQALRSILPVFDEIIVVDNGSDDGTAELVEGMKHREDPDGKLRLHSYPHRLARFGPEHGRTPEDSLHSAVYYTNWSLSHCSYRYVCKWDGDMVLAGAVRDRFGAFLRRIAGARRRCWVLAGQTIYRDMKGDFYLARGEINREVEIFPYGFPCRFVKHPHWERLKRPFFYPKGVFEPVCFFETKFVDQDEFSHWSTTDWPTERKRREWANYRLILEGNPDPEFFEPLGRDFLEAQAGAAGTSAS